MFSGTDSFVNGAAANGTRSSSSGTLQEQLQATGGTPPTPPVTSRHQITARINSDHSSRRHDGDGQCVSDLFIQTWGFFLVHV